MSIDAQTPSDALDTVSKSISELKQKMECAGAKRRRYTSQNSQTSTGTQVTNVSDDSSQCTSPTEGSYNRHGMSSRPVFTLDSQDEEQYVNPYSPFGNGAKIDRTNFESVNEARRNQLRAKRMRAGRRQSESVIGSHVSEQIVCPHRCHTTMCMTCMSMQEEIGEGEETFYRTNSNSNYMFGCHNSANPKLGYCRFKGIVDPRNGLNNVPVQQLKSRAHSLGTLDSVQISHVYDIPDPLQKKDTVVQIQNDKTCTRIPRKRPNSVSSETASEISRTRPRGPYDNDPGYIRTEGAQRAGFCETLKYYLNRHGFIILLVLNVLLLFVNFAGLPYLAMKVFEDRGGVVPSEKEPYCFNCRDMPFPTKQKCMEDGIIYEVDKQKCCFKSWEHMQSWLVKQVSKKERPFIYLRGNDNRVHHESPKQGIRWQGNPTGPMKMAEDDTRVQVSEKGYYFIFSRVHYREVGVRSDSEFLTLDHKIIKYTNPTMPEAIEKVSQKCNVVENSTALEHNSVLQTIAFLQENEHITIEVNMAQLRGHLKKYTLGLFKLT